MARTSVHSTVFEHSGYVLFVTLLASACLPQLFLRNLAGFALVALILTAYGLLPAHVPNRRILSAFLLLNIAFVAWGIVAIIASYAGLFPSDALLPVRSDYILRHAFFLILWLPFLFGSVCFWSWNSLEFERFAKRFGLTFAILAVALDLATAYFFGSDTMKVWLGYKFYLEKLNFGFLFIACFVSFVLLTQKYLTSLIVLLSYFMLSRISGLGTIFTTETGILIMGMLLIGCFAPLGLVHRARLLIIFVALVFAVLLIGIIVPDLFAADTNVNWRLLSWRSNLIALGNSKLLGVGFGAPYHEITTVNLANTLLNADLFEDRKLGLTEPLYFRGQHSSIVNVFYRMGILGGILFVAINTTAIAMGYLGLKKSEESSNKRLCFIGLILFLVQIIQMSLHVGLETPRFVVLYALSLGLIVVSFGRVAFERDLRDTFRTKPTSFLGQRLVRQATRRH